MSEEEHGGSYFYANIDADDLVDPNLKPSVWWARTWSVAYAINRERRARELPPPAQMIAEGIGDVMDAILGRPLTERQRADRAMHRRSYSIHRHEKQAWARLEELVYTDRDRELEQLRRLKRRAEEAEREAELDEQ